MSRLPFHVNNRRDEVKPQPEPTASVAVRFFDNPEHFHPTYGVLNEDTA